MRAKFFFVLSRRHPFLSLMGFSSIVYLVMPYTPCPNSNSNRVLRTYPHVVSQSPPKPKPKLFGLTYPPSLLHTSHARTICFSVGLRIGSSLLILTLSIHLRRAPFFSPTHNTSPCYASQPSPEPEPNPNPYPNPPLNLCPEALFCTPHLTCAFGLACPSVGLWIG